MKRTRQQFEIEGSFDIIVFLFVCSQCTPSRWNCNYREGWDASLTKEAQHPSVGPASREVITKFGSKIISRDESFERSTMRHSNGLTANLDRQGSGVFKNSSSSSQLQASLVPGASSSVKGRELVVESTLLNSRVANVAKREDFRSHHPPPARQMESAPAISSTSQLNAPYLWKPEQPTSVTYGIHRRW